MFEPAELLGQAQRALLADPCEATLRRVISGCYYAVFLTLSLHAARAVCGESGGGLVTLIARHAEHREIRDACDRIVRSAPGVPKGLESVFAEPLPPAIVLVAAAFRQLQDDRYAADYDIVHRPSRLLAASALTLAHRSIEHLAAPTPDMRAFLTLLLLPPRRRRG